ncbi:MAG: FAD-dependent oxidoreductase [bacterium]|nr:FAD-dependent oxidoreductase [bacterium]
MSLKKSKIKTRPRVLQIGVGRFGRHHLRVWQQLDKAKKIELVGAVVASKKSQRAVAQKYNVPVFTRLDVRLLKHVDAVDIVTPVKTHYAITKKCLRYADVFIEKPLAPGYKQAVALVKEAKRYKRVLMVGHIYRFHPVALWLKKYFKSDSKRPSRIDGQLTNPIISHRVSDKPLEFLHLMDIIDFVFDSELRLAFKHETKDLSGLDLRYTNGINAQLRLGYFGDGKVRTLDFHSFDERISADLDEKTIIIHRKNKLVKKLNFKNSDEPLGAELRAFLKARRGRSIDYPDAKLGAKIVGLVESIKSWPRKSKPRVAIIGGGIFGATCAIELGESAEVHLFERHNALMQESSFANQYRHHWGYHYPRSSETAKESLAAQKDFSSLYGQSVVDNFISYYCVSKKSSRVTSKEYLKFCRENKLSTKIVYPADAYLDRNKVGLCLATPEGAYNYSHLKKIAERRLLSMRNVRVHLGYAIVGAKLNVDGTKSLAIKDDQGRNKKGDFDYVINATYANINQLSHWLGFAITPLRLSLKEIQLIELPIPNVALTIMDGPFATIVPTGQKHRFTFGHVPLSIRKVAVPRDGLMPKWKVPKSIAKRSLRDAIRWYPILKRARLIETRFVALGVKAYHEHDDNRTSDVITHGFGCWSILGGKIVTCVSSAKSIAKNIKSSS